MKISLLKKGTVSEMGAALKDYGWTEDKMRWSGAFLQIDLTDYTQAQIRKLRGIFKKYEHLPRMRLRIADVDSWLEVLAGDKQLKCKKIKFFLPMLKEYLRDAPKHWVYERLPESEVWQPYYVSDATFTAAFTDKYGTYHPAHVDMNLHYEEFGKFDNTSVTFYDYDCEGMTVAQALGSKGYVVEGPEQLASYQANKARYESIWDKVGRQFLGTGSAQPEEKDSEYWYRTPAAIQLEKDGEPAKVVIDVFKEGDKKSERDNDKGPSTNFWRKEACHVEGSEDDDDNDIGPGDEDDDQDQDRKVPAAIPLYPSVKVFDLKRHMRLTVHVDQLQDYVYDRSLAEKLILPDEVAGLIELLVAHKAGFRDIVGKKGGGAVVLCAGRPGTGKTLTAEVYSEAKEKPLYSVQCSQLGLNADDLEKNLLKVFARAARWNAILLLDEADVYVAARGSDLVQNAIVGGFLRVLEYYQGVLFMTTNRADLVDDAVASRCLARIDYDVPSAANQARIWRVLADNAGLKLPPAEIGRIVEQNPGLSGRDVKNLLKLAALVSGAKGEPVTADVIKYVRRFKPTADTAGKE